MLVEVGDVVVCVDFVGEVEYVIGEYVLYCGDGGVDGFLVMCFDYWIDVGGVFGVYVFD